MGNINKKRCFLLNLLKGYKTKMTNSAKHDEKF